MGHNYESDFKPPERVPESLELLPTWNTWATRTILKGLAGLFLAIPVLSIMFSFYWPISSGSGLVTFLIGIVLWGIFYQMEMEYRKLTPDRIR